MPVNERAQALLEAPAGPPPQLALGGAGIDRQVGGLGGMAAVVDLPAQGALPQLGQARDHP